MTQGEHRILNEKKVHEIVSCVTEAKNIEILNLHHTEGSEKGANYSSEVVALEVVARVDGVEQTYNWIVKLPPINVKENVFFTENHMEWKEHCFYETVLPNLRRTIEERGAHDLSLSFCSCPYTVCDDNDDGHTILVLENLKKMGFGFADNRRRGLSQEYCKVVLKALADFHAVSHVYYSNRLDDKGEFKEEFDQKFVKDYMTNKSPKLKELWKHFDEVNKTIQRTLLQESQDKELDDGKDFIQSYLRYIEDCGGDVTNYLDNRVLQNPSQFNVLCHGDLWFSNMLFKHNESGHPTEVSLLDLALPKWSNPCTDLVYFFFISTSPEMRKDNLNELLQYYHARLSKALGDLGSDPNLYSLEQLHKDYHYYIPLGFAICLFISPLLLARPEDVITMEENIFESGTKEKRQLFVEKVQRAFRNEPFLKEMIRGNFMEMVQNGYIKL